MQIELIKKFEITRYESHKALAEVTYIIEATSIEEAISELEILDSKEHSYSNLRSFEFEEFEDGNAEWIDDVSEWIINGVD